MRDSSTSDASYNPKRGCSALTIYTSKVAMKAMFNAVCRRCFKLRPRCAMVYFIDPATKAQDKHCTVLCGDCRKRYRRRFRIGEMHR